MDGGQFYSAGFDGLGRELKLILISSWIQALLLLVSRILLRVSRKLLLKSPSKCQVRYGLNLMCSAPWLTQNSGDPTLDSWNVRIKQWAEKIFAFLCSEPSFWCRTSEPDPVRRQKPFHGSPPSSHTLLSNESLCEFRGARNPFPVGSGS